MCHRCGAVFPTKQKLDRHAARKRPCPMLSAVEPEIPPIDTSNPNQCRHCRNNYSRIDSLKRHLTTCRGVTPRVVLTSAQQEFELHRQRQHFEAELAKRDAAMAILETRLERLDALVGFNGEEAQTNVDIEFDITTLVISKDS